MSLEKVQVTEGGGSDGVVLPGQLDMPFMRKLTKADGRKWPRIELSADTMRIGKTTAVGVLADQLARRGIPVVVGAEEWENNVYLKDAYNAKNARSLSKFLLKSERWFAKRKYEQVKRAFNEAVYVQDVNPEMDFMYALTNKVMYRMSEKDFTEFSRHYLSFDWEAVPFPDLLIYLTASDRVVLKRTEQALRDFETVRERYFLTMKRLNQLWLTEARRRKLPVLEVQTDDFDFATKEDEKARLADLVLTILKQQGWDMTKG